MSILAGAEFRDTKSKRANEKLHGAKNNAAKVAADAANDKQERVNDRKSGVSTRRGASINTVKKPKMFTNSAAGENFTLLCAENNSQTKR